MPWVALTPHVCAPAAPPVPGRQPSVQFPHILSPFLPACSEGPHLQGGLLEESPPLSSFFRPSPWAQSASFSLELYGIHKHQQYMACMRAPCLPTLSVLCVCVYAMNHASPSQCSMCVHACHAVYSCMCVFICLAHSRYKCLLKWCEMDLGEQRHILGSLDMLRYF